MKKKQFFAGVLALALAVAAGYGVKSSMNNDAQLSDRAIANIEALANNESGDGKKEPCILMGGTIDPNGVPVRRCSDCGWVSMKFDPWDRVHTSTC